VLERDALPADVVGCFARPAALDRLAEASEFSVRVAPDELLVLGERERLAELAAALSPLDPGGLALDLSSGFSLFILRGEARAEAFCRLSAIELPEPPALLQGLVAQVPAKVLVREQELVLIVSSALGHHLRERVLVACADLAPSELPVETETLR
jgi:sarcosine oxidase gamma subunit